MCDYIVTMISILLGSFSLHTFAQCLIEALSWKWICFHSLWNRTALVFIDFDSSSFDCMEMEIVA